MAVPTLFALGLLYLGLPVDPQDYDSGAYAAMAIDWLNNGFFAVDPNVHPSHYTVRLPGYPFFLTIVFFLFGHENYSAVLVAQTFIAAGTIFFTELIAREFNEKWTWWAAILASLTLNMSYRGTLAMPDLFMAFLLAGFVFFSLRTVSARQVGWPLAMAAFFGAFAIVTRPVFQFVPLLSLPVFVVLMMVQRKTSAFRALGFAAIILGVIACSYGAQVAKVKALTGHGTFTTQTGKHALWMVACLAQPYGCGNRNLENVEESRIRFAAMMEPLSFEEKNNPAVISSYKRKLAVEMFFELPLAQTLSAVTVSMVKMMSHSTVYEIYSRNGIELPHISKMGGATVFAKISEFAAVVFGSGSMLIWLVSQLAVITSRLVELVGIFSGLIDREQRWKAASRLASQYLQDGPVEVPGWIREIDGFRSSAAGSARIGRLKWSTLRRLCICPGNLPSPRESQRNGLAGHLGAGPGRLVQKRWQSSRGRLRSQTPLP